MGIGSQACPYYGLCDSVINHHYNMKSTSLTLLNSIKLLKSRSVRRVKMFPLSSLTTSLLPTLAEVNTLALGRIKRVKDRIRVSHNFLVYLSKMYRHHGADFTIK